jgi:hypothetical protein
MPNANLREKLNVRVMRLLYFATIRFNLSREGVRDGVARSRFAEEARERTTIEPVFGDRGRQSSHFHVQHLPRSSGELAPTG